MKTAFNAIFDLEMDKLGQMGSLVPMSVPKLIEISDALRRAHKRLE